MNNMGRTGASKWALLGLFSLVVFMLVVAGYWFYRQETRTIQNHEYDNLKAIADLKVSQISRWRMERIGDARLNSSSLSLRSNITNWIKAPDNSSLKKDILERLKLLKEAYGYEDVILTDEKGRILLNLFSQLTGLEAETKQLVAKTASAHEVVFGDFFRCPICKQVHLDVAAPVLDKAGKPMAVLILRTNPLEYLYPLIQTWPTASKSAETLLVRKDGNNILFLNVLRHRADPALTLRIPMSRADIPAVGAVIGKTGVFEGRDYRGVKVLSDIRPIPNSSWFMVAKVDKEEILAEVAEHARLIGFLTLALVVLSGVATAFVYKHQGKRTFQALYTSERERAGILEQARVTLYSIGDAVITTGGDGWVKQMNPVAEQLTGWKEAEALGKPLSEVFHIVNEETRLEVENPVIRVLREGLIIGLANHTLLIARDGVERPIADSGAPIRNEAGEIIGVVLVFRDQTEERKNLTALQESMKEKAFLADLVEQSSQPLGIGFPDGRVGMFNTACCKLLGYSKEELKTIDWATVLTPAEWRDRERAKLEELHQTGQPVRYEKEYLCKDGARVPVELLVHLVKDEAGQPQYYYSFVTDITERKRSQDALQTLSSRQEALLSAIPDIIMEVDESKIYTWANQPGLEFFGPDVIGKEVDFYFEGEQKTYDIVQPLFNGKEDVIYLESWQRRKDGQKRLLAWWCRVLKDENGHVRGALSSARDITIHKQAEEALRESEERYRQVVENANEAIFVVQDDTIKYFNSKTPEIFGDSAENLPPGNSFFELVHPDDRALVLERYQKRAAGEEVSHGYSFRIIDRQGNTKWVEINSVLISWAGRPATLVFLGDITERKTTEEKIILAKEEWERTFDSVPDLIVIVDQEFRVSRVNRAMAERLDLTPREMIGAFCYELIHGLHQHPSACPHGQVIIDGKEISSEFHEPKLGGHFLLTVSPLYGADGRSLGVIHVFRDITDRKKAEEKVIEGAKKLQKALEGIVQAMAATVEVKDPYTAGHQRRVADLSRAIAQEMGFSDDRIEGIHMAGMIHDLGKLSVPAEILSKPTQLSNIEFSLIKVHPQAGYDILKEIDFPWPIARIVFQHHERINGSGYPQGIKGEEILPEAKVLAVADVVEAIASHRPYRPALGIDKALEEIQKNKSILYDPEVVEICLRIFREKRFVLE